MRALVLVAVSAAIGGCNDLLDLEPGTPLDPEVPSCLTGWRSRVPIDIANAGSTALTDFQIRVPLRYRGDDLRFVDDAETLLRYAIEDDAVWVTVPELLPGTTRIHAYYDHPGAPPWNGDSPFVADVLSNASFESAGAWSRDTIDEVAVSFRRSNEWSSLGEASMLVDEEVNGTRPDTLRASISQDATFPEGSSYAIRFDLRVIAASYSVIANAQGTIYDNSGLFFVDLGNGLDPIWHITAHDNITGTYRGEETTPIGPGTVRLRFGVGVEQGVGPGYAKANVDNLRVRKLATPEPDVVLGDEQAACNL